MGGGSNVVDAAPLWVTDGLCESVRPEDLGYERRSARSHVRCFDPSIASIVGVSEEEKGGCIKRRATRWLFALSRGSRGLSCAPL